MKKSLSKQILQGMGAPPPQIQPYHERVKIRVQVELEAAESGEYFINNDSMRDGYIWALKEVKKILLDEEYKT